MAAKDEKKNDIYNQFDGLEALVNINKIMDKKAQEQGIMFSTMEKENRIRGAVSTGVLSFDLIMGGGYAPGTFSYLYGPTGSCKSTLLYHTVKEAIAKQMIASYHDHECSADPAYLEKIGVHLDKVCGFRNKKGEWEETPRLRYAVGTVTEATFKYMNLVMKSLPDKIVMQDGETHRHFLVSPDYEYSMTWKSLNKGLAEKKVIEVEGNSPQLIFLIDSLKAMLPEARDEDMDKDPIALQARTFAQCFPLIKSLLGRKNCLLVATNHLTINPMARFGNPETEPGGTSVQFYPDFKMKLYINRAQSKIEEEEHFSGSGVDRYLYGTTTIMKNKFGPSFRKSEFRLWLDEKGEPGRGIDPVYDMYNFLQCTNLLDEDEKDRVKIKIEGFGEKWYKWTDFKAFVIEGQGGIDLREKCQKMLTEGKAQELYYEYMKKEEDKEEDDEDDDDDDEDDDEVEVAEV